MNSAVSSMQRWKLRDYPGKIEKSLGRPGRLLMGLVADLRPASGARHGAASFPWAGIIHHTCTAAPMGTHSRQSAGTGACGEWCLQPRAVENKGGNYHVVRRAFRGRSSCSPGARPLAQVRAISARERCQSGPRHRRLGRPRRPTRRTVSQYPGTRFAPGSIPTRCRVWPAENSNEEGSWK